VVHGIGEHGGRYVHVAEYLAGKGFGVWVPDQRGCGRSFNREGRAVWKYEELVEDLCRMIDQIAGEEPGIPLILIGHSLGGLTVLKSFLTDSRIGVAGPLCGIVLSSPAVGNRVSRWRTIRVRFLAGLLPRRRIYFDAGSAYLTHDPRMSDAHRLDPLICRHFTLGFLRDIVDAQKEVQQGLRRIPYPLLCLSAGDDRLVDTDALRMFYDRLEGEKEWTCYDGFYHELFNEVGREKVFERIEEWLDRLLDWR
jgi:alpha-beta hydrolase superfamily lysophospholipase